MINLARIYLPRWPSSLHASILCTPVFGYQIRRQCSEPPHDRVAFVITLLALAVGTICWGLKVQKQLC